MNYYVRDGEQSYGPYTLTELQQQVQSGKISASALAQSEGMSNWVPISDVIGNIFVPPPAAPAIPAPEIPTVPLPPNMHWGILLVLVVITRQLFNPIWALILANWARKLDPKSNALILVVMYPAGLIAGVIAAMNGNGAIGGLLILAGGIAYIIGVFSIKAAMELYYNWREKIGLQLSGPMTFFFSSVYIQYHVNRLARWKKTGKLP